MRKVTRGARGWRQKWRRAAPEHRQAAAESLADLFARRRVRTALWAVLLISLAGHAAILPMLAFGKSADTAHLVAEENSYLQKVMQKDRARQVSRDVQDRVTMPPPPPEPEAVVEQAMSESLTDDVAKITGNLLPMELQKDLAQYVQTNLRAELAAAAKDIATGQLSEDEIERLHRQFQDKAHKMTVTWREEYLKEHQVERAAMSTTEWYESDVSKTLVNNMYYELFLRPHRWAWREYSRRMGRGNGRDAFIVAGRDFGNRLGLFGYVPAGRRHQEEDPDASWPGPNAEQARWLQTRLKELCDGTQKQYRHNYAARTSLEGLLRQYAVAYCPHRPDDVAKVVEAVQAARAKADAAAAAYVAKPDAAARAACLAAIKAVADAADGITKLPLPRREYDYHLLNRAVKTEVLRGPFRTALYNKWIATLVDGLSPMIRDFAKGQFKKGIIVHKDGVDEAMKEFPKTIVPLLQRDMKRLIPEKRFYEICFEPYQHVSKVTGDRCPPTDAEAKQEAKLVADACAKSAAAKAYCDARRRIIPDQATKAMAALAEEMLTRVLVGNLLFRSMGTFVEGVDYTDKVQEKLTARQMALKGRGQDLAKLTDAGVPDTSAPLVALIFGASKGHGANLQPVETFMQPAMITDAASPEAAILSGPPVPPGRPRKWGFEEQPSVKPSFKAPTPRFEGIPFLTQFPTLDGDLRDWGHIRPLILRRDRGDTTSIVMYAAWNYQGFFFGYEVRQDAERFYYPSLWRMAHNHNTGGVWYRKVTGVEWAYYGDYCRLLFDTLDARNGNRGEPHTQEFTIFPMGIESDPNVPGIERVIASQRDAQTKQYRGVKATCKIFPHQPPPASGPDGSGPYRVTKYRNDGYSTEVFIPRSLFNVPVFAPGWTLGFDCAVATGVQPRSGGRTRFRGQAWATGRADNPNQWGDLLLLGTDPRIVVQEANRTGHVVYRLIPGRSYLLTVIDPDRNVSPAGKDTLLVSAEVNGLARDVEVFILTETADNSGIFRGYVNTQPGTGRQVQGVLEIMALQEVRFGYVDFANAKGQRNVITEMKLPVMAPVTSVARVASAQR